MIENHDSPVGTLAPPWEAICKTLDPAPRTDRDRGVPQSLDGSKCPLDRTRPNVLPAQGPFRTDWTDINEGAALLNDLNDTLKQYVIFPTPEAADAVTLYIAVTHCLPAFQHATRLVIS